MKEVMVIVRINMMNRTKEALTEAGVFSMTARDALGRGKGLVDGEPSGRRRNGLRKKPSPSWARASGSFTKGC